MRSRRGLWDLFSKQRFRPFQSRPFCTNNSKIEKPNGNGKVKVNNNRHKEVVDGEESSSLSRLDAYKELDNLNFMTAARILFSDPPKKKNFGLDFHLVQLFFACLPALAVYLVAQYARSEMRRMEGELEIKKKAEKEKKAKEAKLKALEEQEETSDPQLLAVKMRLEKLEETIREIADESKKKSNDARSNTQGKGSDKSQGTKIESKSTNTATASDSQEQVSKGSKSSASVTETPRQSEKSAQEQVSEGIKSCTSVTETSQQQNEKSGQKPGTSSDIKK